MQTTTDRKHYPREHWSQWPASEEFADLYLEAWTRAYQGTKLRVATRMIGPDLRGMTVLDYGGGGGMISLRCAEMGATVTLVDAEPNPLQLARILARRFGVADRLETVHAESLTPAVVSRRYHLVVLMDVIEHLPADQQFLLEVSACQKPGDRLFISTHNSCSLNYLIEGSYHRKWLGERDWCGWDPTHYRFYTPWTLAAKLKEAGYRPRRWWGTFVVPYNIASWFLLLRARIEWPALRWVDLTLGRVFPFNRLGWTTMVMSERT